MKKKSVEDVELYISVDVEADGPIPGPNSMLSLGAAAFLVKDGGFQMVGMFKKNLEQIEGASPNADTLAWWKERPLAWELATKEPLPARVVMYQFTKWVESMGARPVFVGYPVTYDFLFVYWYLMKFVGHSPFSHSGLDIKTFAMSMMNAGYRDSTKKNMPKRWFSKRPHTHDALEDAIEQGELFMNMLQEHRSKT